MSPPRSFPTGVQSLLISTLALYLLIAAEQAASASAAPPLRICVDPDNLPFASDGAATRRLYLELAEHIAAQVGRAPEPVWIRTYEPERVLRATLLAHRCDVFVGVPSRVGFMAPRIVLSHPVLEVGYALVTPPGSAMTSLGDLSGRTVAVEFGSPAQDLLARRDDDVMQAAVVNDPDALPLRIPTITKDSSDPTSAPATATAPSQGAAPSSATPASGLDGHVIFIGTCAACHGPDAVQAERRINLRLLHARYGSNMDSMFFTTVTDRRPSKGMPSWKGAFTDAELGAVLAYLHSVQE